MDPIGGIVIYGRNLMTPSSGFFGYKYNRAASAHEDITPPFCGGTFPGWLEVLYSSALCKLGSPLLLDYNSHHSSPYIIVEATTVYIFHILSRLRAAVMLFM